MLLLEDVLYDASAHTNDVSLLKLNEAGLYTSDINAAGVTIYNAVDNGPVGRATVQESVYCLEDLAPPPSATTYPSRPTIEAVPSTLTPKGQSPVESSRSGSHHGVANSLLSVWSLRSNPPRLPTPEPVTTAYPPFESALKSTPTIERYG